MSNSQLKSFVERIEHLGTESRRIDAETAAIYEEAKQSGLSAQAIRRIVIRRQIRGDDSLPIEDLYFAFAKPSRVKAVSAAAPIRGYVYFVHFPASNRLKIGFTSNLSARIESLGSAAGEINSLIGMFSGSRSDEATALAAFAEWRLRGEWHSYTPECAESVSSYLSERQGSTPGVHAMRVSA